MSAQRASWTTEHVDFLTSLHREGLSRREMSVLMSKNFKMRITPSHVGILLTKMRTPGHNFFRDISYRTAARRHG